MNFYQWFKDDRSAFMDYVSDLDWAAICNELDQYDKEAAGKIVMRGLKIGLDDRNEEDRLNDSLSREDEISRANFDYNEHKHREPV